MKKAYDTSVETTIYCAPEATGRGIGSALYTALFDALRDEDLHMAVAGITLPNAASVALHERFGFVQAGLMHAIGRKFDQYWDVGWYERSHVVMRRLLKGRSRCASRFIGRARCHNRRITRLAAEREDVVEAEA